jgi:hypothetical protein
MEPLTPEELEKRFKSRQKDNPNVIDMGVEGLVAPPANKVLTKEEVIPGDSIIAEVVPPLCNEDRKSYIAVSRILQFIQESVKKNMPNCPNNIMPQGIIEETQRMVDFYKAIIDDNGILQDDVRSRSIKNSRRPIPKVQTLKQGDVIAVSLAGHWKVQSIKQSKMVLKKK